MSPSDGSDHHLKLRQRIGNQVYQMFNHSHQGLAMLSVLLTAAWALAVLAASKPAGPVPAGRKLIYTATMAVTGLTGIAGLVLILLTPGTWLTMWFPWLGLAAVALHGVFGVRSRKALAAGSRAPAVAFASAQFLLLVAAYGLMTVKPF